MMRHAGDPLVFTRSTVSRGHVGGLTAGVRGMIRIMGLIKCDVVLIETVGGGQSDVEVASVVDLVVVVLAPGQGDSIQLLKSGLMEAGDIYVVNKADQEGAAQLCARALAIAPLISRHGHQGQATPVCLVSALQDRGVAELRDQIEACFEQDHDRWQARRREAITQEVTAAILEESRRQIFQALQADGAATEQIHRVLRGEVAIPDLVRTLLQNIVAHAPQGA
jgi:LAO/AO transport system kinase